jgi:polyhydroxybutyrate depolymerase
VQAARATGWCPVLAALVAVMLVAGCTVGHERPKTAPGGAARPSLVFVVVAAPLDCQVALVDATTCSVGGSGPAADGGKLRLYHDIRLGPPGTDGCAAATTTGSISGAGWAVRFTGDGRWCGQAGRFSYRFSGRSATQGRLVYQPSPSGMATETFTGPLPAPPPTKMGLYGDRPVASRGCGRRPPTPPGQATTLTLEADPTVAAGATRRTYRVHIPASYRPRVAVPAVLFFHGHGGSAADMDATTGLSELADRRGFLAVYPQGLAPDGDPSWADAGRIGYGIDDLRYTIDLLNHLQDRLCVNPRRVYAGGFSNGGGMTGWLACELAGRIAAFAAISGTFATEPGGCHPTRPVPILDVHGTADSAVPYSGRPASTEWPFGLPSIPAWLARWAARDGCAQDPVVFLDRREVTGERWSGCRAGARIVAYRINGGGHAAPRMISGQPIAEVLWRFFTAYQLPT